MSEFASNGRNPFGSAGFEPAPSPLVVRPESKHRHPFGSAAFKQIAGSPLVVRPESNLKIKTGEKQLLKNNYPWKALLLLDLRQFAVNPAIARSLALLPFKNNYPYLKSAL